MYHCEYIMSDRGICGKKAEYRLTNYKERYGLFLCTEHLKAFVESLEEPA